MNKYIIPICDIDAETIKLECVSAVSIQDCKDELMDKYSDYSCALDWDEFVDDMRNDNFIIGAITDIEEL